MSGTFMFGDYRFSTLHYMAPERIENSPLIEIDRPSKMSDVYSLAMTSFRVCPSTMNYPAT
jgi:serine/threonine protein kinase